MINLTKTYVSLFLNNQFINSPVCRFSQISRTYLRIFSFLSWAARVSFVGIGKVAIGQLCCWGLSLRLRWSLLRPIRLLLRRAKPVLAWTKLSRFSDQVPRQMLLNFWHRNVLLVLGSTTRGSSVRRLEVLFALLFGTLQHLHTHKKGDVNAAFLMKVLKCIIAHQKIVFISFHLLWKIIHKGKSSSANSLI